VSGGVRGAGGQRGREGGGHSPDGSHHVRRVRAAVARRHRGGDRGGGCGGRGRAGEGQRARGEVIRGAESPAWVTEPSRAGAPGPAPTFLPSRYVPHELFASSTMT